MQEEFAGERIGSSNQALGSHRPFYGSRGSKHVGLMNYIHHPSSKGVNI